MIKLKYNTDQCFVHEIDSNVAIYFLDAFIVTNMNKFLCDVFDF